MQDSSTPMVSDEPAAPPASSDQDFPVVVREAVAPADDGRAGRVVRRGLLLWSLTMIGVGVGYLLDGRAWSYVAIAAGVFTALSVWRARGTNAWVGPLYQTLFVLAFAMIAAGMVTELDVYISNGILAIVVLAVGATITHSIGQLAQSLGSGR